MKKLIKFATIGVGVLLVAYIVGNFVTDGKLEVSQSLQIDAAPSQVFKHVNNVNNWESWSPWKAGDPTLKMTYGEVFEGKGASYSWKGDKTGEGRMQIVESTPVSGLKTELWFQEDPDAEPSQGTWSFEEKDGGTWVTWELDSQFPWGQHLMALVFEGAVSDEFATGLSRLKSVVETGSVGDPS